MRAIFRPNLYSPHLLLQMDFNKHSGCLKLCLAQVSKVECSRKTEKEDASMKHPVFLFFFVFSSDKVYGFYMCLLGN